MDSYDESEDLSLGGNGGDAQSDHELFDVENENYQIGYDTGSDDEERRNRESSKDGDDDDKNKKKAIRHERKIVRNPGVFINLARLKSENGLTALYETGLKLKMKGVHHEKEDLGAVIEGLQHWMCHNLYPGGDFESCTQGLEDLGNNRKAQIYLRKWRRERLNGNLNTRNEMIHSKNETEMEDQKNSVVDEFTNGITLDEFEEMNF